MADDWELCYNGENDFVAIGTGSPEGIVILDGLLFDYFQKGL